MALEPGPFPTTPILDAFAGPDAPLAASPTWGEDIRGAGTDGAYVIAHQLGSLGSAASNYRNQAYGPDQEVYLTVEATAPRFELWARTAHAHDSTQVSAYVVFYDPAIGSFKVQRYGPTASPGWVDLGTYPRAVGVGDGVGLRVWGGTVEAWHRPATGLWQRFASIYDSAFPAGDRIGFILYGSGPRYSGFGGGNVVYVDPSPPPTGLQPWIPDDCETMEYRNPQGEVVRFRMLAGAKGRLMPPVKVSTLPVPIMNGSRYLGAQHGEALLSIPVAFPGTLTDRAELRRWARVLDPVGKGEGVLSVVNGPGAGRQLLCTYDAGMDELEEVHPNVNLGVLLFRAAWPYWQASTEQSVSVRQGDTDRTWFPFLPLILGASDAFAVFNVGNSGDVPAWPVFTIVGPGTAIKAENLTTGQAWQITGAVPAGSQLVVDTRPGAKSVTIDGVNSYTRLVLGSELWPLQPGLNQVQLSMALTSPAAIATLTWRDAWLSA